MKNLLYPVILGSIFALCSCATSKEQVTTTQTTTQDNANVKIINGKRYVYVPGELGSNIPGRWVPEDSPAAQVPSSAQTVDLRQIQSLQTGGR